MNRQMERARARYKEVELPAELDFAVASAIRAGDRKRRSRDGLRRTAAVLASCCACFVLLLNVSPTFAQAVEAVPVLGALARVVTVREYRIEDKEHLIDVRLPALKNTGNTDLEQRVNTEISTRIQQVLDEAEARARADKEAFVATGGQAEDFIPIIIDVDYEIKCQNGHYLSFILTKTETLANAYTEYYAYNIDLETGRELTLRDLLGPDWKRIANEAVRARPTSTLTVRTALRASSPSGTTSPSTSMNPEARWWSSRNTRSPRATWACRNLRWVPCCRTTHKKRRAPIGCAAFYRYLRYSNSRL